MRCQLAVCGSGFKGGGQQPTALFLIECPDHALVYCAVHTCQSMVLYLPHTPDAVAEICNATLDAVLSFACAFAPLAFSHLCPCADLVNVFEVFLPQLLLYPNPTDPLNGEAAALLMRNPQGYSQKVKGERWLSCFQQGQGRVMQWHDCFASAQQCGASSAQQCSALPAHHLL